MRLMEENKELHLLGVSFRDAPAAVREGLSFNRSEAAALLQAAVAETPGLEAMVLSTCNRTEFYLVAPQGVVAAEIWLQRLRTLRPEARILRSDCLRYQQSNLAAAQHLFRVACGLESAILGDFQILGQVKEAHAMAAESGALGGYLNRVVLQAIHAGKRARTETAISQGAASTGSALVGMLSARFPAGPGENAPHLLIVGAGKIARDIGRHAAKRWAPKITFLNRTEEKAAELARLYSGSFLPWSGLSAALLEADVAVFATGASRPVLNRAELDQVAARRGSRPLLVVDAGVPRNVEPGSSIEVMDIDSIQEGQEAALSQRQAAVPVVERIVEEEVHAWEQWQARRPVEDLIKLLYQEAAIQSREVSRDLDCFETLTASQAEQVFLRSMKRVLHSHVHRLRSLPLEQEVMCAGGV